MSLFDAGQTGSRILLADLLAIENSSELLEIECPHTGIPVWPNVRVAFFRQIMADLLFTADTLAPPPPSRRSRVGATLARAAAHNFAAVLGRQLRSDILINTDAIGDELHEGRWFNRYADPFGDLAADQAVVLMDLFEWQWRLPRYNERIFYHAPIQAGAALAATFSERATPTRLAAAVTTLACDRAKKVLGWEMGEARRATFEYWSARKIAGVPYRYRAYRRLVERVRPRLLLGLAGCYGAHAPLIAAARDLGIVTAEFQHGAISRGHDAYNFAPAIFASAAYRRTLPHYLLTYGDWWSAQVAAPVECVTIGNPTREGKLDRFAPRLGARRSVLVLSDGLEFDLYLALARAIAPSVASQGLEVALRPHPMERSDVRQKYGGSIDGVLIDDAPDIYASFAGAHAVISEVSTGLFEAAGLVNRIILLNTAKARFAYPEHPFAAASSVSEVIDLIRAKAETVAGIDGRDLWASDWRKNYQWFLRSKVGIDGQT